MSEVSEACFKKKLMKPGPAISIFSIRESSSLVSSAENSLAMSRGALWSAFA